MQYQATRGTTDILPEEQKHWSYVVQTASAISARYGYHRIDTPVFEDAGLFVRSIGEETDIVEKETYTFEDKGGNKLTLRPEGTAPVCRAFIEHGMSNLPQPVKLYYLASIFRYERPQAGRLREHHQFGFEALGEADPALDAEVIDMAWQFFSELGLKGTVLYLNSIGCGKCRPGYLAALKGYYSGYQSALCPDCQRRLERNPLRLLDCKKAGCLAISARAPQNASHLCSECAEHFRQLKGLLSATEIPFELNHRLVRGLDYYTRTVFEIQPEVEGGAQSTIGGGGRYDGLIEQLGGRPTPAVGFATGIERLLLNLRTQEVVVPSQPAPAVFVAYLGKEARVESVKLASSLRKSGVNVISAFGDRSLKAQLKQAGGLGVRYAVIIGEEEVRNRTAVLRDMAKGEQRTIAAGALAESLRAPA